MSLNEKLTRGLQEALDFKSGKKSARVVTINVATIQTYQSEDVKRIRNMTGLSQKTFAHFLGVSPKTVEAWEYGRNKPDGVASRMLSLTEANPQLPFASGILSYSTNQ